MSKKNLVLNDVCKFVGGSQPPKDVFINEERGGYIRLIQTRDYKTDSFKTYIPIELARRFCNKTDIMIGRYGPPVFQILRGLEGAYNVALMKAIPKRNIRNEYLYYFLSQNSLFKYVDGLSKRTGGQTGVDLDSLRQYPIELPEFPEQDRIIKVLGTLDRKIVLNHKINVELEAMAKSLYEYWFVQFDFPDKNGKPYKSSGGKMLYNEELKREIPEGWEVKKLSEIADIVMGQSPSGSSYNSKGDGMVFFQGSTDFGWRFPSIRQYTTSPKRLAKEGDILISVRAPVGTLNIAADDCCIGRGLAALRSKKGFNAHLYYVMEFFKKIFDHHNNTGTTFGSITKNDLYSLKLPFPPEALLKPYENIASVHNRRIFLNHRENVNLKDLRDWLLPMLMNGQVSVGDAEEEMGMVAKPEGKYSKIK